MLECLEAADRSTELDSLLGVFHGEFQASCCGTDLLGGQQNRCDIDHARIAADHRRGARCHAGQPSSRVQSVYRLGGHIAPAQNPSILNREHHIGDITVDHVVAVEDHRSYRCAGGKLLKGLAIGLIAGQQAQLGERCAEQGSGNQRPAQFFQHRCRVGQFAACATHLLGYDQCGHTDLLAQQCPKRFVVPAW